MSESPRIRLDSLSTQELRSLLATSRRAGRQATADQVQRELDRRHAGLVRARAEVKSQPPRSKDSGHGGRVVWTTLAAVAVLTVGGGVFLEWRDGVREPQSDSTAPNSRSDGRAEVAMLTPQPAGPPARSGRHAIPRVAEERVEGPRDTREASLPRLAPAQTPAAPPADDAARRPAESGEPDLSAPREEGAPVRLALTGSELPGDARCGLTSAERMICEDAARTLHAQRQRNLGQLAVRVAVPPGALGESILSAAGNAAPVAPRASRK